MLIAGNRSETSLAVPARTTVEAKRMAREKRARVPGERPDRTSLMGHDSETEVIFRLSRSRHPGTGLDAGGSGRGEPGRSVSQLGTFIATASLSSIVQISPVSRPWRAQRLQNFPAKLSAHVIWPSVRSFCLHCYRSLMAIR